MEVRHIGTFVIGLLAGAGAGAAGAGESLCAPDEEVFFSCRIKDSSKLLSVCGRVGQDGSRKAARPGDYLQYRFGLPDRPELVYPASRAGSRERFQADSEWVPSAFFERFQLRFRSGGNEFRVYAVKQSLAGRDGPWEQYGGVIVGTGSETTIACAAAPEHRLGSL